MRNTAFFRFTLGVWLATFALATGILRSDDATLADDGWRRTTRGWERTSAWTGPESNSNYEQFIFEEGQQFPRPSWDLHPGLLVAGQVLLIGGAFYLWPISNPNAAGLANNGIEDAIERQMPARNPV